MLRRHIIFLGDTPNNRDYSSKYREGTTIISLTTRLIKKGQFDEIFENIVKFVVKVAKRDYSVPVEALKAMEGGEATANKVAKRSGMDRISAYNILEELRKMEILSKEKIKGRAYYRLNYPLLQVWLKA